jgi:hypothetical protein
MSDDTISITVRLREAARFAAQVREERREIRGLGDDVEKAGRKGKKASAEYTIFGAVLKQVPIMAAVGALGLLTHIGIAAGGAIVGLVAAMIPLVGLIGALPAAAILAGQGLGVMLLSLKGIGDAVGGLNEALDPKKFAKLTPEGQKFALLLDALKPRALGLQRAMQRGLFPGLTAGLKAALPALSALKGPLEGTGRVLGTFGKHLGQLVGSKGFLTDLSSQAKFNNVQLGRLGGAGLHLVNMFRNLMVGARGLVSWLVKGTAALAATGDHMVADARHTGALQRGFHTVQVTTERWLKILWRLGVSLFNIGRIGKQEIGDGIVLHLLHGATALERWTRSGRGIQQITGFFAQSRNILHQVGATLQRLRNSAGAGLGDALRNIVSAITPLLASGGGVAVLKLYVQGLSGLASVVGWLGRTVPGASAVMSAFLTLFVLGKISSIAYMGKAVKTLGRAIFVMALQTRAGVTAFWALNAALYANPVGAIVIAVAAVGAALYLAYQKVGWFHRAVDNVFRFIRKHWKLLGSIMLGPLRPVIAALGYIVRHFRQIRKFVGNIISGAGHAIGSLIGAHADGGVVRTPLQIFGERGPELAAAPIGTRVFDAPTTARMLRAPRTATVRRNAGGSQSDGGGGPVYVHATHILQFDGKAVAKVVSDQVARQKGRA